MAANVLLITVDQWRGDCLSGAGHPVVRTPNLDRLAAQGVRFDRHYAQAAPCGPSRASLHTGLYMMNHRAVLNGTPLDARFTNVALEARGLGYDPVLFGYTDATPDPRTLPADDPRLRTYEGVLPGYRPVVYLPTAAEAWGEWLRTRGYDVPADVTEMYRPVSDEPGAPVAYSADDTEAAFLTGEILDWLDHRADEIGDGAPFFVHVAYLRPHPPFVAPEPYNAMYDPAGTPAARRWPTVEEEARQHPFLLVATMVPEIRGPDDDAVGGLRATYYGMMSEVDAQIGRLLDGLADRGLWDDTLVVLTSDHGEQLGDHWLTEKLGWFDESYYIPLIVRDPRDEAAATRGTVVGCFTENVDVMPTILDWIGAEVPAQCDGASLLPFLHGESPDSWRREVHWEWDFRDPLAGLTQSLLGVTLDECCLAVVRDEHGKYVHFGAPSIAPVFYDLDDDPFELRNRASDPGYAARILEYAQKMLSWRLAHADRTLTGYFVYPGGLVDARHRAPDPSLGRLAWQ